ncbi:TetR/AcrR family transcriptional regulator [Cellulomonas composti]|uniref:TetR family transcriptional regulator n=1 Tax=Cellulomonas composti TaxID=266130 RepID=A0A511J6Z2_9CELL|nr:TetR/AcrR family transcriptional regulator [Cellulomonas composti]GEL93765.1 TetR family transcriptional regulator [Cellulomonas composti]
MPRAGLSPQLVADLALAVVDEHGPDALTLAAVAQRAGVAVPSLYKHVAGLPALRAAVALHCVDELADVMAGALDGRSSSEALVALAHALRRHALAHPGRYAAAQSDWVREPSAELLVAGARAVGVARAAVAALGVPPDRQVDAVRAVRATLHGFVSLELAGGFGMPDDVDVSFDFLVAGLVEALVAAGAGTARPVVG